MYVQYMTGIYAGLISDVGARQRARMREGRCARARNKTVHVRQLCAACMRLCYGLTSYASAGVMSACLGI